ncbi:MAG: SDR family NAD(P)-dependent oxidoreductase [Solirubrobacteraceae bacterium]
MSTNHSSHSEATGPVLVTGAGGFIGGHLAAELTRRGAKVRALLRYTSRGDTGTLAWLPADVQAEVETVFGDLRDVESVHRATRGMVTVFHLAAQIAIPYSYVNPRDFFETNVLGTLNVAQAALSTGVERLVHTSTSEVYGTAQTAPITETHPLEAQSPYAASKIGADKLIDSFHRSYGLPVVTVRPFNTYGPHQSPRAIIPTVIGQALAGDSVRLGALEPRRDLTYVSDTVAGFLAAAQVPEAIGRTIQLGTGEAVSVAEIVDAVAELLGRPLDVEFDPERLRPPASEVQLLVSDSTVARELIAWRPAVELRTGLSQTIAWMRCHGQSRPAEVYAI